MFHDGELRNEDLAPCISRLYSRSWLEVSLAPLAQAPHTRVELASPLESVAKDANALFNELIQLR